MRSGNVLDDLRASGAIITASDGALQIDAPRGVLTPKVLAVVKEHKAALLQVLAAPVAAPETGLASTCADVLRGQTVVANKHRDHDLIAWAKAHGLAVVIMRPTKWGNPLAMKGKTEAERNRVCDEFETYIANSPKLRAQIGELRGKVLICCCKPARCHGDTLARLANAGFDVGAAYDPEAARCYADELHRAGEVTTEQHANLITYVRAKINV